MGTDRATGPGKGLVETAQGATRPHPAHDRVNGAPGDLAQDLRSGVEALVSPAARSTSGIPPPTRLTSPP